MSLWKVRTETEVPGDKLPNGAEKRVKNEFITYVASVMELELTTVSILSSRRWLSLHHVFC